MKSSNFVNRYGVWVDKNKALVIKYSPHADPVF